MLRKIIGIFIYVSIIFFTMTGIYFYHRSFKVKEAIPDAQFLKESEPRGPIVTIFKKEYDLEVLTGIGNTGVVNDTKACSGKNSCELNAQREYGITLLYPVESIQGGIGLSNLKLTAAIWSADPGEAQWVMEIMDPQNKSASWASAPMKSGKLQWDTLEFFFDLPQEFMQKGYVLKLYPWNKNLKQIWIDNICVTVFGRTVTTQKDLKLTNQVNYFYNLESNDGLGDQPVLDETISHSGKRSAKLNGKDSYSPSITKVLANVSNDTIKLISASVWLYPEEKDPDAVLAVSIDDVNGVNKFWLGKSTEYMHFQEEKWQKLNASFGIPDDIRRLLKSDDKITIYVWNRSRMKIYADDFEIVYGEEADRPGQYPNADMNISGRSSYSFDRFHPPYRINYINSIDLKNDQSQFLVNGTKNKFGELFPQNEIISLKSGSGKQDFLLSYTGKYFELFKWCETGRKFQLAGHSTKLPFNDAEVKLFAIDVDGDGSSEILTTQGSNAWLLKYATEILSDCLNNQKDITFQVLWQGSTEANSLQTIGNFDNDPNQEWLTVDKTSSTWNIRKFMDEKFSIRASGNFPGKTIINKEELLTGKFLTSVSNAQLLINGTNEQESVFVAYEYNLSSKNFRVISTNRSTELSSIFKTGRKMLKMRSANNEQDDILLIDLLGKFGMYLIKADKQGFYVHSQLECLGFPKDYNPKFFEFIKPVIGKFNSESDNNLLMILRNCADEYFDGKKCQTFGGNADLPDQLQMYSLKFD